MPSNPESLEVQVQLQSAGAWLLRCAMCLCMHVQSGTTDLGFVQLAAVAQGLWRQFDPQIGHTFSSFLYSTTSFCSRFDDYHMNDSLIFARSLKDLHFHIKYFQVRSILRLPEVINDKMFQN